MASILKKAGKGGKGAKVKRSKKRQGVSRRKH
jgi:hypothetical protein